MTLTRSELALLGGLSLNLLGLACAGGRASERIRYDRERTARLRWHDEAVWAWHGFLMAALKRAEADSPGGAPAHVVR